MTVAIALERYFAVHFPLDYNQENSSVPRSLNLCITIFVMWWSTFKAERQFFHNSIIFAEEGARKSSKYKYK